jgi:hypothetical protein
MTDWQLILLQIRRNYKPLAAVAREIGMSAHRLQKISQEGTQTMLYENGKKLIELHRLHCLELTQKLAIK